MLVQMVKALLQKIVQGAGAKDKYRPERHYMRGPGPKSKARETVESTNNAKA